MLFIFLTSHKTCRPDCVHQTLMCIERIGIHRSASGDDFRKTTKIHCTLEKILFKSNNYILISPFLLVIERTIQRRISDSVNFNRDWDDYVTGFGEEDGNYWMGLEEMHQLTTTHDVSLFIDIETFVGLPFTLKLQTFSVGNEESNYTMHYSGYSQSSDRVTNPLFPSYNNGMMFSTRDRDNDKHRGNCASDLLRGGWWYRSCTWISLNGDYEGDVTPTDTGILVKYIDTRSHGPAATKAVKSVEMIIRTRVE